MWLKLTDKSGEIICVNMSYIECIETTTGETKSQLIIYNHPEGYSYAVRETPEQLAKMINAVGVPIPNPAVGTLPEDWAKAGDLNPKLVPKW